MRISLITSSFYPALFYGGPIASTWDFARKIGEKGIEIYVSTTNANGKKKLQNVSTKKHTRLAENVFVRYYNEQIINFLSLSFLFNIYFDIKRSDVVYIQYLFHYTVIISLFFSWFLNKKIILCPRGSLSSFTLSNDKVLLKKLWLNLFIHPFSNIINWQASSYLEKEDILDYFPESKVLIIPDGIDFMSFQDSSKIDSKYLIKKYTNHVFDDVSEIVFSMGRLHKIKRFDILIDAFGMYINDNKNAKLLIAGSDDGVRDELLRQIDRLGLSNSVFLIGLIDFNQKKEILSNCSFFCLCSDFESFGIVIAEALACGLPVIISDKTPWKDLQKNNCGIFANNKKDDILRALKKIKQCNFQQNYCKKYVRDNFDWDVISDKFLKLITNN